MKPNPRSLLWLLVTASCLGGDDPASAVKRADVHGDPARLARIRAARMPAIDKVISFDTVEADAVLSALEVFPPDNPWNLVVSDWPPHPRSREMVAGIGPDKVLRANEDMFYPATHHAGHGTDENLPRMGERFRLRQDLDTSGFSPTVRTILEGLKKYGMFVADNGIEWAISIAPDPRIPDIHEELRRIKGADFEVVQPPPGYQPPAR